MLCYMRVGAMCAGACACMRLVRGVAAGTTVVSTPHRTTTTHARTHTTTTSTTTQASHPPRLPCSAELQEALRQSGGTSMLLFKFAILLVDEHDRAWPVQYEGFMSAGQRHLRLGAGWRYLCRANAVAVGERVRVGVQRVGGGSGCRQESAGSLQQGVSQVSKSLHCGCSHGHRCIVLF